jgi:hypothetical protein
MSSRPSQRSLGAHADPVYAHAPIDSHTRRRALRVPSDLTGLPWLLVLLLAAAYVVVFLLHLPRNVADLSWDSDYASSFVMSETLVHTGTGGDTVLASASQWVPLWFGLLTARLPLHRELWGVTPSIDYVLSALTVGSSVAQVAGRRAAALAVLLGIVVSPLALSFFMAPEAHNTVWPCTALLGAYLVWLAKPHGGRRASAVLVPPLVGVALGACLASDLVVAAAALAPLAITALMAGVRRERRSRIVFVSSLVSVAVALPTAALTSSIMRSFGYRTIETPARIAPLSELPERARVLFEGLRNLFNGAAGPEGPGILHAPLSIASEILMCAVLLALVVVGVRTAVRFLVSGLRRSEAPPRAELARSVHVIYWVSSAACVCGAFWLAAETGGNTVTHESYYATVIFSVAAVVPLGLTAAGRLPRWLMPACMAIFFAASLTGLIRNYLNVSPKVASEGARVVELAEASHVSYGYGGYWAASSVTWHTHGHVTVRPLIECENPTGVDVCPFYEMRVPSWYVPARRPSFLLVDHEEGWVNALPRGLGRPVAVYAIGPMSMYIYPYDLATRLGSALD